MSQDNYRNKIKHASWTWREEKVSRYHGPARRKDRVSGRNSKRSARQADLKEIDEDSIEK